MTITLPQDRQPVLRIVPMPADTNAHGTIFGGWVMAQVDIAGSIPAWERAAGPVVTVAVNSVVFKEPVFVGDDATDEDGFSAVQLAGGWGVKVGEGPSGARFRLADPRAVQQWLADSLAARPQSTAALKDPA